MAKRATKTNGTGRGNSANDAPADTPVNEAVLAEVAISDGDDKQGVLCVPPPKQEKGKSNGKAEKKPLPVGATVAPQGASDGGNASAASASKTPKERATGRDKTEKSPPAKKGAVASAKTAKKGVSKAKAAPAKPTTAITMGELADSFLHHLEAKGKSAGTVFSYAIEMKSAIRHFGEATKVAGLTKAKVKTYFECDTVTLNRKGKPKSQLTIDKTRRVFRQALAWLAEVGVLAEAPIPEIKKAGK